MRQNCSIRAASCHAIGGPATLPHDERHYGERGRPFRGYFKKLVRRRDVSDSTTSLRSNAINLVNRAGIGAEPKQPDMMSPGRVALLIPCYNEEAAIGQAVRDF